MNTRSIERGGVRSRIDAIRTMYRGVEFRSRLEARWACFFDSCKIAWRYEPEGVRLLSGEVYLPDFYLPDWGIHCEVKPYFSTEFNDKCEWFLRATGSPILLVFGMPGGDSPGRYMVYYKLHCLCEIDPCLGEGCFDVLFAGGQKDDRIGLCVSDELRIDTDDLYLNSCRLPIPFLHQENSYDVSPHALEFNYGFARSAKFEYGERPDFDAYCQKAMRDEYGTR